MRCPQCKAEYRSGFTVCKDCGVQLVESRQLIRAGTGEDEPAATPGDPNKDPFCSFWKGTDLRVCTELCSVLDEAGIPQKTIRRQDHMFNLNNQSPYEVGVPASMYEKSELAVKNAFGTDAEGAEDAVYESEEAKLLPDQTNHVMDAGILSPLMSVAKSQGRELLRDLNEDNAGEKRADEGYDDGLETVAEVAPRRIKDFENLDPADATVEVWRGEDADTRGMLEMSLRENDIFARFEERGGAAEVYVLPDDEERATEIVREILEGKPPE